MERRSDGETEGIPLGGGDGQARVEVARRAPYTQRMDYRHIITLEPGKRGGKPCIRGMRITVADMLDYLASGMTPEQILADFPELTGEDIRACLSYAADRERHLLTVTS